MAWGALFIGLLGRALIPEIADLPDQNSEMIYLVLASEYFGPILYGLLVGGIFAAILSTADSQLLVVASTFVRDIYEKIIHKDRIISENDKLRISRWVVLAAGIIAMGLAWAAKDLIFWLVLFAWGGLGASFGPVLILSLYWKGLTRQGVLSAMISGTTVILIWRLWIKAHTGIYELIPAFFLSGVVAILVSKLTKPPRSNSASEK